MKKRNKPVIPGFGLSMGITISILSLVVLIPLASLVVYTAKLSFKDFIETITRTRVLASFYTSFVCAFAAAVINGIMGTILAWVLVKYDFPGKRLRNCRKLFCRIRYQDRIHKNRHYSGYDICRNTVRCAKCTAGSGKDG
mgnify:CR=1 FL=1